MSSKDLDDICSSDDDWGECMDVENEPSNVLSSDTGVNLENPIAEQPTQSVSPSIEMAESVDTRAQKSPIEMDSGSPSDKSAIPEVEMTNPTDHDAEMRDLTTERSPEDLGELKSPSPAIEMIEESAAIDTSTIDMKETSDENIESELLNSPTRDNEQETADLCTEEDEALKSPEQALNNDRVEEKGADDAEDTLQKTPEPTSKELDSVEPEELPETSTAETKETGAERDDLLLEKANKSDTPSVELAILKESISTVEKTTVQKPLVLEESIDTSVSETEESKQSEKLPSSEDDKTTNQMDTSIEGKAPEERSESALSKEKLTEFTGDDTSQTSLEDRDSEINFDEESQCSGDATNKDLVNIRDNMEGVTLPAGTDGDVNEEEETGDDPLGAVTEKEDQEEEILGDTSSAVSILPDSAKTISPGYAEGDEILPDTNKDKPKDVAILEEILPDTNKDKPKDVTALEEILPDTNKDKSKDILEKDNKSDNLEKKDETDAGGEKKLASVDVTEVPKDNEDKDKKDTEKKDEKDSETEPKNQEVETKKTEEAKSNLEKSASAPEIEVMDIDDDDDNDELNETELKASGLEEPNEQECSQCKTMKKCHYKVTTTDTEKTEATDPPDENGSETVPKEKSVNLYICDRDCFRKYKGLPVKQKVAPSQPRLSVARPPMENSSVEVEPPAPFDPAEASKRRCSQCKQECNGSDANLSWETMDFCNEECLGQYQRTLGSFCANCRGAVMSSSMGKYCVRFGFNVRQFCSSACLEEFKKGLKVCSYCQRDITGDVEGFLAPIGDKGQFKDFCSQDCMTQFEAMGGTKPIPPLIAKCAVCYEEKEMTAEVINNSFSNDLLPRLSVPTHKLCSNPCLAAFKFANDLVTESCKNCKKHFNVTNRDRQSVYMNDELQHFCSKTCLNVKTIANRKIVACNWCKVKKYNFDMIRKMVVPATGSQQPQSVMLCSLNCLALYQVSITATSAKLITCDHCGKRAQGMYHLTMSDATLRNFCCYQCCMAFQTKFSSPILTTAAPTPTPTGTPMLMSAPATTCQTTMGGQMPVITNVTSLAPASPKSTPAESAPPPQIKLVQQVIVKPSTVKAMANKSTSCRPNTTNKGVSCKPICNSKGTQTEDEQPEKVVIPIPVPIYVPAPMHMFSAPFPVPVPFPLPIAVPIFIPTTRNTAKGIRKEIKRIQEQIPRDPFEAELLMMAEMVAEDRTGNATSSDSDDDNGADNIAAPSSPAEPLNSADSPANSGEEVEYTSDTTPTFGEDMLQMALKMASELTEPAAPAMDLEAALPAMAASAPQLQHQVSEEEDVAKNPQPEARVTRKRGRTRGSTDWAPPGVQQSAKRTRANSQEAASTQSNQQTSRTSNGSPPVEQQDPAIEADPSLSLKYTYGVLAFRKWIRQKNAETLVRSGRNSKLLKTDILQLSTDELNFALCMFVKEVRKPDGEEYAPDIIYYLCLGIQLYLYRSHRIDNIFTDAFYEKFTESLNDITLRFTSRLNDRSLVTRVEEEHLWESQQLGAHSPHVLLFTLMYFNTKHFLLTEVEDHMRLSFTHVMKHWKRNHAQPGKTGATRNVLLRYYPPQAVLDADERKKKVYEQQENEQNPLRCPVKLYEFYVSKCPESVRGRNDVFYLLPERSCVPDSPVWYSTMALPREAVSKMLNRIRMVREVLSLLHSLNY